ncbi:MAG: hypothetical protein ACM3ON_01290, partial [Chloroflexota bacterium]
MISAGLLFIFPTIRLTCSLNLLSSSDFVNPQDEDAQGEDDKNWYLSDLGEARGKQHLFTKQSPQKLKVR